MQLVRKSQFGNIPTSHLFHRKQSSRIRYYYLPHNFHSFHIAVDFFVSAAQLSVTGLYISELNITGVTPISTHLISTTESGRNIGVHYFWLGFSEIWIHTNFWNSFLLWKTGFVIAVHIYTSSNAYAIVLISRITAILTCIIILALPLVFGLLWAATLKWYRVLIPFWNKFPVAFIHILLSQPSSREDTKEDNKSNWFDSSDYSDQSLSLKSIFLCSRLRDIYHLLGGKIRVAFFRWNVSRRPKEMKHINWGAHSFENDNIFIPQPNLSYNSVYHLNSLI